MPKKLAQKSGWRVNQARIKLKKKTRLGIAVLILVFILIILGQIINFGKVLFSPWNPGKAGGKSYLWDDRFNINLVIKAKSVAVMSLNPAENQVTGITLPENTLIDVPGGFGKWQIRSVYNLGQSENESWELLKKTLSTFLGIPIDGVIEFRGSLSNEDPLGLIQKFQQSATSGIGDIKNIQTNLTLAELIRLKFNLSKVRFDKIRYIDLEKRGILDESSLNDGTKVFTTDAVKLDSILSDLLDPVIRNEYITIAIFNAAGYPQLAQKAARLVTNMGGNAIITANAEKTYAKTQVMGKESQTFTRLSQIFDLGCNGNSKCDRICDTQRDTVGCIRDANVMNSRAQINIILGKDFYMRE